MKKTMFITAMLITILATMLVANFAFAAAPARIAAGGTSVNVPNFPRDELKYESDSASTSYAPLFMIATSHRGNYALSLRGDLDPR